MSVFLSILQLSNLKKRKGGHKERQVSRMNFDGGPPCVRCADWLPLRVSGLKLGETRRAQPCYPCFEDEDAGFRVAKSSVCGPALRQRWKLGLRCGTSFPHSDKQQEAVIHSLHSGFSESRA